MQHYCAISFAVTFFLSDKAGVPEEKHLLSVGKLSLYIVNLDGSRKDLPHAGFKLTTFDLHYKKALLIKTILFGDDHLI